MTDEQKGVMLELALKEVAFLRGELAAMDGRVAREVALRKQLTEAVDARISAEVNLKFKLKEIHKAVDNARVLRETTDLKEFRVHLVEAEWDRIVALAEDPT